MEIVVSEQKQQRSMSSHIEISVIPAAETANVGAKNQY